MGGEGGSSSGRSYLLQLSVGRRPPRLRLRLAHYLLPITMRNDCVLSGRHQLWISELLSMSNSDPIGVLRACTVPWPHLLDVVNHAP